MSTPTLVLPTQNHWLADGTQTVWEFTFANGYIDPAFVKAYSKTPAGVITEIPVTEDMFFGEFQLNITPAVAAGDTLVIHRATPKVAPLVDWNTGARVNEVNLDTMARQSVHIAAEMADFFGVTTTEDLQALASQASAAQAAAVAAAGTATTQASAASASAIAAAASANAATNFVLPAAGAVARPLVEILGEVVSVRNFSGAVGDGVTVVDAAVTAALAYLATLPNGGVLEFPAGTWRVTTERVITSSNVHLRGQPNATIFCDLPEGGTDAAFNFSNGAVLTTTSLTANVLRNAAAIQVSDGSLFNAGDYFTMESSEYFSGISGVAGYGISTKGEQNRVLFRTGNTIYLAIPAQDSYDNAAFPVTVYRRQYRTNCSVSGLTFRGTGNGVSHSDVSTPTGGRALRTYAVDGFRVENCNFIDFPRFAIHANTSLDVQFLGNRFIGRDLAQLDNSEISPSFWFTGVYLQACQNAVFANNLGAYLRRAFDSDNGSTVSRNIILSNNVSVSCRNGIGVHGCEHVLVSSNMGQGGYEGLAFRGKNLTMIGNHFLGCLDYAVKLGGLTHNNMTYIEAASVGRVVMDGNHLQGGAEAVWVTVDVESLSISGGSMRSGSSHCMSVSGRTIGSLLVDSVELDGAARASNQTYAIYVQNTSGGSRKTLSRFRFVDNTVIGFYRGVVIEGGGDRDAPTGPIDIVDNLFESTENRDVHLLNAGSNTLGFFGKRTRIARNSFSAPAGQEVGFASSNRYQRRPAVYDNDYANGDYSISGAVAQSTSTLPTTHNYVKGQRIDNTAPAAAGYIGWVVTAPGTTGTLAGVFGDTSVGSPDVTLSNTANVFPGTYITVTGAGFAAGVYVLSVVGSVATMSGNAANAVVGGSVAFAPPTVKGYGLIET